MRRLAPHALRSELEQSARPFVRGQQWQQGEPLAVHAGDGRSPRDELNLSDEGTYVLHPHELDDIPQGRLGRHRRLQRGLVDDDARFPSKDKEDGARLGLGARVAAAGMRHRWRRYSS